MTRLLLAALLLLLPLGPAPGGRGLAEASAAPHRPTRLFLARHGQRIDYENKDWVVRAHNPFDPYSTKGAVKMAAKLGCFLNDRKVERVLTSPSLRAVQYANAAAMCMDGIYHMYPETGICDFLHEALYPGAVGLEAIFNVPKHLKWVSHMIDDDYGSFVRPKFPESLAQFERRCKDVIGKVCEAHAGQTLLIVSHAATLDLCIKTLCPGVEVPEMELGALTELVSVEGGGWEVVSMCYTGYMQQDFGDGEEIINIHD